MHNDKKEPMQISPCSTDAGQKSNKKRYDIQGLRTFAIFGVLLFHLWPDVFRQGYLGVDIFFVLSGYLMGQCLMEPLESKKGDPSGGESPTFRTYLSVACHFYTRRIHRIVPVYVAVVCGTLSIGRALFLDTDFAKLRSDSYWALTFTSNIEPLFAALKNAGAGGDYFAEVFSYRALLHTWSLGVEMQFYLLIPGILFTLNKLVGRRGKGLSAALNIGICLTFIVLSLSLQFWLNRSTNSVLHQVAFMLLFCRFWQFFSGISIWFLLRFLKGDAIGTNTTADIHPLHRYGGGFGRIESSGCIRYSIDKCQNKIPSAIAAVHSPHHSMPIMFSSPAKDNTLSREGESNRQMLFCSVLSHFGLALLLATSFSPWHFLSALPEGPVRAAPSVLLTALLLALGGRRNTSIRKFPQQKEQGKSQQAFGGIGILLNAVLHFDRFLLTNPVSVWIGDLSYVWYLVHWPVFVLCRYFFSVINHSAQSGLAVLALSFIVAVIVDRLIDGHVRKLRENFCAVLFIIGLLYAFCAFFILPTYWQSQADRMSTVKSMDGSLGAKMMGVDVNFTRFICDELQEPEKRRRLVSALSLFEKIKMNELMQKATFDDRYEILPGEWKTDELTRLNEILLERPDLLFHIVERRTNGTGSRQRNRILLVGNSHADVLSRSLQHVYRDLYSTFHTFTIPGCMPVWMPMAVKDEDTVNLPCFRYAETVQNALKTGKYDILFMAFKWYRCLVNEPIKTVSPADDEITRTFQQFLDVAELHVKQIFFPAPNLMYRQLIAKELAKRLWQRAPLEDLHITLTEHRKLNQWAYQRMRALRCSKCVFYDIADNLCDPEKDRCWAFDEEAQLAYLFDTNHLSYLANLKIRPFLRRLMTTDESQKQ